MGLPSFLVQSITSLKSTVCRTLTTHNTTEKNKVLTRTHTTQLYSSPMCFTPQYIAYRPQGSTGITSTCKITVRVNIIADTALAELTVADTTQQFALHICSCSLPFRDVPSIPGTGTSFSVCTD